MLEPGYFAVWARSVAVWLENALGMAAPDEITSLIPISATVGIIFAVWLWRRVAKIKLQRLGKGLEPDNEDLSLLEEQQRGDDEV